MSNKNENEIYLKQIADNLGDIADYLSLISESLGKDTDTLKITPIDNPIVQIESKTVSAVDELEGRFNK